MVRHELKNQHLDVYYRHNGSAYSISLSQLGNGIDWRIAEVKNELILCKNVSEWTLHLMSDKDLTIEFALGFQELVKKYCPNNTIDWTETERAILIYNEYRKLRDELNLSRGNKLSRIGDNNEIERLKIVRFLKEKYHLD